MAAWMLWPGLTEIVAASANPAMKIIIMMRFSFDIFNISSS
jgi:hypothetical protein